MRFRASDPKRKKLLLSSFASIDDIRLASIDELTEVCGIGKDLATSIKEHLMAVSDPDPAESESSE